MKKPPVDVIIKVVHKTIDQHCGRDGPTKDEYVPNYWSDEDEFNQFISLVNHLIISSVDNKHGQADEINLDLPDEAKKAIQEAIEIRRGEIRQGLINKIITSPSSSISSNALLKDFDWQIKMILASNLVSEINESLVNLDLVLTKPSNQESERENVLSIEMDKKELRRLITELEELAASLDN